MGGACSTGTPTFDPKGVLPETKVRFALVAPFALAHTSFWWGVLQRPKASNATRGGPGRLPPIDTDGLLGDSSHTDEAGGSTTAAGGTSVAVQRRKSEQIDMMLREARRRDLQLTKVVVIGLHPRAGVKGLIKRIIAYGRLSLWFPASFDRHRLLLSQCVRRQ
jgi:hypothetical protein